MPWSLGDSIARRLPARRMVPNRRPLSQLRECYQIPWHFAARHIRKLRPSMPVRAACSHVCRRRRVVGPSNLRRSNAHNAQSVTDAHAHSLRTESAEQLGCATPRCHRRFSSPHNTPCNPHTQRRTHRPPHTCTLTRTHTHTRTRTRTRTRSRTHTHTHTHQVVSLRAAGVGAGGFIGVAMLNVARVGAGGEIQVVMRVALG